MKRILIVDDEISNIKLLQQILKQKYQISVAKNGVKALALAQGDNPPDLILLDIQMPEMDGYEVCRQLKNQEITQDIPIIFVTTRTAVDDECIGFDLGGVDYITKPISAPVVLRRVNTHLSLVKIEEKNITLHRMVAERTEELEQSMMQRITLEKKNTIAEERSRIMRDMHDGMGGQLVSALAMASNEDDYSRADVSMAIKNSLTDLRLIIDSMDVSGEDINALLGMFRSRVQYQLDVSHINMSWQVDELNCQAHFSADKRLQLLRILQEIMNNIIKHSEANQVVVTTFMADHSVVIVISDNGKSFDVTQSINGRGLVNMQYRAKQIGADLSIINTGQGTDVKLLIQIRDKGC
jgi:CheY-like chemotaxis protein